MHYRPVAGWGRLPGTWSFVEATRVPPVALLAVLAGTILGASVGESVQAPGKELGDDPSDRRRDHRFACHASGCATPPSG